MTDKATRKDWWDFLIGMARLKSRDDPELLGKIDKLERDIYEENGWELGMK